MQHVLEDLDVEAPPCPMVLLLHEGGSTPLHVDWLIARNASGSGPLLTFRLPERLDTLAAGDVIPAMRIQDHRPRYLRCDGPLGGDRGEIQRIARGRLRTRVPAQDDVRVEITWMAGPASGRRQELSLVQEGDTGLQVRCRAWEPR